MGHAMIVTTAGKTRDTARRAGFQGARAYIPGCASWLALSVFLCLSVYSAAAAEKNPNAACLECHADKTLYKTNSAGVGISLYVEEAKLVRGVHNTNNCIGCHSGITDKHPDD